MSSSALICPDSDVETPLQVDQARARALLTDVWRAALDRLTELSVLTHSLAAGVAGVRR